MAFNPFLHFIYRRGASFSESAASATQGVVGAEQRETFEVLWDKESAYACLDLDGTTTAEAAAAAAAATS